MNPSAGELPGLGGSMALSFVSLGVVCLAIWATLRFLASRGFDKASTGPIKVVGKCTLEPRRSLYVIEAGGKRLLIGVGEGAMTVLTEMPPEVLPEGAAVDARSPSAGRFPAVLARVMGRKA